MTNIIKNKRTYMPFILSAALMFALLYDILALVFYEGMSAMYGGVQMAMVLKIGALVMAFFIAIFLFYTNNYVIRERKKSIGLYAILGMNKRNIAAVVFIETVMIFILATVLGLVFGMALIKLFFAVFLKLNAMTLKSIGLISQQAVKYVLLFALISMVIAFVVNLFRVSIASPLALLNSSKMADKPLKSNMFFSVVGLFFLGGGYFLAQTIQQPIAAIGQFFIATVLVIIGTFVVMRTTLTWLFTKLKCNKNLYYHHRRFIALSGIIHRIGQNANGLASICVLSTAMLITVATTVGLFAGVDDSFSREQMYDYTIGFVSHKEMTDEQIISKRTRMTEYITQNFNVEDMRIYGTKFITTLVDGNVISETNKMLDSGIIPVVLMTIDDYNKTHNENINITRDAHIVVTGQSSLQNYSQVTLLGETLNVTSSIGNAIPRNKFVQMFDTIYTVVLKDTDALKQIISNKKRSNDGIDYYIEFDSSSDSEDATKQLRNYLVAETKAENSEGGQRNVYVIGRKEMKHSMLGLYSGLLFIGIIIGTLFMVATGLVIYYKQVSEGYQDKMRYAILTKVGMKDSEVKKTINAQVKFLFFIPIVMMTIHLLFAFRMITLLLRLLGLSNTMILIASFTICVMLFIIIYYVFYKLSSRAYYQIVNEVA